MSEPQAPGQPPEDAQQPPPAEPSAPEGGAPKDPEKAFSVDLGPGLEEAFRNLREKARHLVKKGQHTNVRIKFRGREVATLPLSVLIAAEAATFWFMGPLRILLMNVVGRAVLDVELVNEADGVVASGKARLLDGELDEALKHFQEAIAMDSEHPAAHLNLGIARKLRGEREDANKAFERAAALDPKGDVGREARRQLEMMKSRAP